MHSLRGRRQQSTVNGCGERNPLPELLTIGIKHQGSRCIGIFVESLGAPLLYVVEVVASHLLRPCHNKPPTQLSIIDRNASLSLLSLR